MINAGRLFILILSLSLTIPASAADPGQAPSAGPEHVRSMPLTNTEGSECPTTGVRVEAVTDRPAAQGEPEQEIVLSIPSRTVNDKPNLKLYKLDNTDFAFAEFKELHEDRYRDRRAFSVVVAKSDNLRFKVGFDSSQNAIHP